LLYEKKKVIPKYDSHILKTAFIFSDDIQEGSFDESILRIMSSSIGQLAKVSKICIIT